LTDSFGNVEYFFLKVVFNSPEDSPPCNLPPSFKGGGIEGVEFSYSGEDKEAGLTGKGAVIYETIYNNRANYNDPE